MPFLIASQTADNPAAPATLMSSVLQNKVFPGAELCNDFLGGPTPCFSPLLMPLQ
jgi:hypothetical protein